MKHDGELNVQGDLRKLGEYVERMGVGKIVVYGHSYGYGYGASAPEKDITTHLASMLRAREVPRARNGAVAHVGNSAALTWNGGYGEVLSYEVKPGTALNRSTTLSAQATAGASTISVTSGVGIANGALLFVGIGASGATGGEMLFVTAGGGTGTLTIQRPTGETTTARTHLNGEPVYVVPSGWINLNPLYLVWFGINDLAVSPWTSASTPDLNSRYLEALNTIIARCRCSDVFEQDHTSVVYTGTWGSHVASTGNNSGTTVRAATVVNAIQTIHVPENFEAGCVVDVGVVINPTANLTLEWRVDGTLVKTDVITPTWTGTGRNNGVTRRFKGLAAGRHTIEMKVSAYTAGTVYADWWGIEPAIPPMVLVPSLNRARDRTYTLWPNGATWLNGQTNRTLTAQENVGSTTIDLNSSTGAVVGATVTFEPGTGNEEKREVLTVPNGTSITVAATAIQHANGSAVRIGMQDWDITAGNTLIQNYLAAEYDKFVEYVDIYDLLDPADPSLFFHDGGHFSDKGNSKLTLRFYDAMMASSGFMPSTMAYTSVQTAPNPSQVSFLTAGVTAANTTWTAMPSALTELFGATIGPGYRTRVDLSKVEWCRFVVYVRTAGFSGSGLRLQFSVDNAASWRYLGLSSLMAEEGTIFQALLTSTGEKDTGWQKMHPDALVENALLRVVGINGNGVAAPVFGVIYAAFR